jgi:hypothetical protein
VNYSSLPFVENITGKNAVVSGLIELAASPPLRKML